MCLVLFDYDQLLRCSCTNCYNCVMLIRTAHTSSSIKCETGKLFFCIWLLSLPNSADFQLCNAKCRRVRSFWCQRRNILFICRLFGDTLSAVTLHRFKYDDLYIMWQFLCTYIIYLWHSSWSILWLRITVVYPTS